MLDVYENFEKYIGNEKNANYPLFSSSFVLQFSASLDTQPIKHETIEPTTRKREPEREREKGEMKRMMGIEKEKEREKGEKKDENRER